MGKKTIPSRGNWKRKGSEEGKCFLVLWECLGLQCELECKDGGEKPKMGLRLLGKTTTLLFRVRWEELEGFEQMIGFKWLRCYEKRALKRICIHC